MKFIHIVEDREYDAPKYRRIINLRQVKNINLHPTPDDTYYCEMFIKDELKCISFSLCNRELNELLMFLQDDTPTLITLFEIVTD